MEFENFTLKHIWKYKGHTVAKTILKRDSSYLILRFRIIYTTNQYYTGKGEKFNDASQNQEVHSNLYGQLVYKKGSKLIQR